MPKKLFVQGATFQEHFKDAKGFGWDIDATKIAHSWKTLVEAKNKVVSDINVSYEQMFVDAKMTLILGWGALESANTVVVQQTRGDASSISHRLSSDTILVCTGGWPNVVTLPGGGGEL